MHHRVLGHLHALCPVRDFNQHSPTPRLILYSVHTSELSSFRSMSLKSPRLPSALGTEGSCAVLHRRPSPSPNVPPILSHAWAHRHPMDPAFSRPCGALLLLSVRNCVPCRLWSQPGTHCPPGEGCRHGCSEVPQEGARGQTKTLCREVLVGRAHAEEWLGGFEAEYISTAFQYNDALNCCCHGDRK